MGYKLICKDKCYPTQYFKNRSEVRSWLFLHARNQIDVQGDLRSKEDTGHDINLRNVDTYGLADYFDFTLTRH